jgi:signal transduction histidine kinase
MTLKPIYTFLLTTLGYWLLANASGFFAIPPGYASPIWPAAGFGLIMLLRCGWAAAPGIFVGSCIFNIELSGSLSFEFNRQLGLALIIASGATINSLVARYLVARFTHYPKLAGHDYDSLGIALLAGPVSCLISATIGTTALFFEGFISVDAFSINWWHWWAGDSIGVLIFLPILLTLNFSPVVKRKSQIKTFFLVYTSLVLAASFLFVESRAKDQINNQVLFQQQSRSATGTIERKLDETLYIARTLTSVFETFGPISDEDFQHHAKGLHSFLDGTHALSWVPLVPANQRKQTEALLSKKLGATTFFTQRNSQGELQARDEAKHYFPVLYIYPLASNKTAIAYDIGSQKDRLSAIERAIASGEPSATQPIQLVQEKEQQMAFLLLSPVHVNGQLSGLISLVYRSEDLLLSALDTNIKNELAISLSDISDDIPAVLFENKEQSNIYQFHKEIAFAGRTLSLDITPSTEFFGQHQSNWVWTILISSYLIVTLMGLFSLLIIARKAEIELEVEEKTSALKQALTEAKEANLVKSAFLASMSHELRTPLNSIIGFSHRLMKNLQGKIDERYLDALNTIERNGAHLLSLINDILDLSKVEAGKLEIHREAIDILVLIDEALEACSVLAQKKGLTLKRDTTEHVTLPIDKKRIYQVLVNLLSNSIKFTDAGHISVSFTEQRKHGVSGIEIIVSDTGVGIPEDELPKLFRPYEQLGNTFQGGEIGTGLGLALVREFVTLHCGEVWASSEAGKGSQFHVWLPFC